MRNNQPVTQREREFPADTRLVSMTDLQGDITFVNRDFVTISGFTELGYGDQGILIVGLKCKF